MARAAGVDGSSQSNSGHQGQQSGADQSNMGDLKNHIAKCKSQVSASPIQGTRGSQSTSVHPSQGIRRIQGAKCSTQVPVSPNRGTCLLQGVDVGAIIARYIGVVFWFCKYRWNDREASFRWRWHSLDNVYWKRGDNKNISGQLVSQLGVVGKEGGRVHFIFHFFRC